MQLRRSRPRWQEPLPLPVVARWLDMSGAEVQALSDGGLLQPVTPTPAGRGVLSPADIDAWLTALNEHIHPLSQLRYRCVAPQPPTAELVGLATARELVRTTDLTIATILKLIMDGTIVTVQAGDAPFLLHRIRMLRRDLETLLAVYHAGERWISARDVALQGGSNATVFACGVQAGWIHPVARYAGGLRFFDRGEVTSFLFEHLMSSDIVREFGVSAARQRVWVKDGALQPLPLPTTVWPRATRRQDVVALRVSNEH